MIKKAKTKNRTPKGDRSDVNVFSNLEAHMEGFREDK